MGNNPYHNQHIAEFTQCMEQAFNDNNNFNDWRYRELLAALESLEKRVTRLEEVVFNKPERTTKQVETDIVVTRESLRKVRDAFMSLFR